MKSNVGFLYLWALLLVSALLTTMFSYDIVPNQYYEEMINASELTKNAFDEIKTYKEELNIELSKEDINETGLIGVRYTPITTTMGSLESKRTSTNPNFSAVIINLLKEGGIKKGDEVVVVFSGSFPALNIATMAAVEVLELKPYIMASVGASTYGANYLDLTYIHMAKRLYDKGYFSNFIDAVSLGGANDTGNEFEPEIKEGLINYIESLDVSFIYEENYEKNINLRLNKIKEHVPNYKILINVGGNLVSMGQEEHMVMNKNGLIKPNKTFSLLNPTKNKGLIQRSLESGKKVIQLLNIKGLAYQYEIPFDHKNEVEIGSSSAYLEKSNNLLIPISTILLTIIGTIFYKFYYIEKEKDENNYINVL